MFPMKYDWIEKKKQKNKLKQFIGGDTTWLMMQRENKEEGGEEGLATFKSPLLT